MSFPFNIRVYGILVLENRVLLSREKILGKEYTKFPGGGLEFGESPPEAIQREFLEETGVEIQVHSHFYTTDLFQISAFNSEHQVISIYYRVGFLDSPNRIPELKSMEVGQVFFWKSLRELSPALLDFPIDKKVAGMLADSGG